MFKASFDIDGQTTIVTLDTIEQEEYVEMQLSGNQRSIKAFRAWIDRQHGPFGHGLSDYCANITDLHFLVIRNLKTDVNPKILEGMELVGEYPSPPEGTVF